VVRRSISIVVALAAAAAFATAHAAGLGRLSVLSPLGQPLLAEIDIVSLQPGEEEGLGARLASSDAFEQAGIEVNPVLNTLRITIEHRDKRPYLRLTTTQPVNDPFLDLLVELQWSGGRLVREYTFLLDPPEYRSREQAIAAAPLPPVAEKPAPAPEEKPAAEAPPAPAQAPEATPTPAPAAEAAPPKPAANTYEVKRGDTLGAIARQHLPPGVSFNQMLIAIFRANEDAFIRGNLNLVRTGKILNIPEPDAIGTVDRDEANQLVKEQHEQFMEYRSRLAALPKPAEAAQGQREVAGRIEQKPEAPKPPAPEDQVRLSKSEPGKPAAPGSRAAREDDAAARERALQESQSRTQELEKNVADLQKLLALKNQQLAEMEKKGGAQPAPVPPVAQAPSSAPAQKAPEKPAAKPAPAPAAPAPQAAAPAPAKPEPPKPAAEAPKPPAEAAKPPAEAPKPPPAAEAPKPPPAAEAPKPAAKPAPKPAAKAPPPPPREWYEEYTEDPTFLIGLPLVILLLVGYFVYKWRRKKNAQAKFQDSVLGAAAAGGGALGEPTAPPPSTASTVSQSASQAPAGMETEEVDPIAEADVYMAYGRDAQAEEILKEALQKDANRTAVHAKLLEIYAHRKDPRSFEQTALKLKGLTNGAGPEWEKAVALGRSIDPGNGLYGGGAAAAPAAAAPAAAAAAAAPTLDFDLGGASQAQAPAPDISLDEPSKEATASGLDFDLGATQTQKMPASPDETVVAGGDKSAAGGLDFNLDLGAEDKKEPSKPAEPAPAAAPAAEPSGGLDFDLNLDVDKKAEGSAPAPEPTKVDLSAISLDLGSPSPDATVLAPKPSSDPKWQEVATKLDLAKAYEEMGDKDGARELLKEVMKDGDAAQRGSAEQLLAKLG
jgi:pilus assembly protein FimV